MTSFHQNRYYKLQPQATNVVYAYNLPMLGALTTTPCTLMYCNGRNLSTSEQEKRKETSKYKILKFFKLKNVEYREDIKGKEAR